MFIRTNRNYTVNMMSVVPADKWQNSGLTLLYPYGKR